MIFYLREDQETRGHLFWSQVGPSDVCRYPNLAGFPRLLASSSFFLQMTSFAPYITHGQHDVDH
jgi:hypothetical protein